MNRWPAAGVVLAPLSRSDGFPSGVWQYTLAWTRLPCQSLRNPLSYPDTHAPGLLLPPRGTLCHIVRRAGTGYHQRPDYPDVIFLGRPRAIPQYIASH